MTRGGHLAYEVVGLGHQGEADDANLPSLLSLPLVAGMDPDSELYQRTRAFALSRENPWWHAGHAASGIGSPHTPGRRVWPLSLIVQALTSDDRSEQLSLVRTIASTDADSGMIHESFDADDPADFTRPWFSWANAMFCELLLTLTSGSLDERIQATY